MRDFGLPVPSLVIALLLGVPPEDLALFQHHTTVGLDEQVLRRAEGARLRGHVRLHPGIGAPQSSANPGDDLISRLVTDHVATGQLNQRDRGHDQRDHDAGRPRNQQPT